MGSVDLPIPSEFILLEDVSAADWVLERLEPWGRDGVRVASFLPDGYEAYVRLPNRWPSPDEGFLDEGSLPRERMATLIKVLSKSATTEQTTLLYWTGWGDWNGGSPLVAMRGRRRAVRRARRRMGPEARERSEQHGREMRAIPQVRAYAREYFAFRTDLSAIPRFEIAGHYRSPSLWWGDDRAWCVASEVDSRYTFIGGSRPFVEGILAEGLLEASEATRNDLIGPTDDGGSSSH